MRTAKEFATVRILSASLLSALLFVAAGCGPKYPKCDKDDQCASHGEVCVEGQCQQCRDDSSCPAGQACKGGRCEVKAECGKDGDCKDNKVCRSGKCQTECTGDGDCGSGLKCKDSRCVDKLACNLTSDCAGGMTCVQGRCKGEDVNAMRKMGCEYPRVHFDFNDATLKGDGKAALDKVAECMKTETVTVTIEGHCDERGTEEYNLALGDKRARSVMKYLERLGVSTKKLNIVSKGELEPIAPGHDEESWAQNRRAELKTR